MKDLIKKIYNDLMPYSNEYISERRLHCYTLELAKKYLCDVAGKRTLDIGCGAGLLVYGLKLFSAHAFGIDKHLLSERQFGGIEECWKKLDMNVRFGDFTEIAENNFDLITAESVFEHLPFTQKDFLEKIYCLLKPGGYAIFTTPNLTHFLKRARMIFGRGPYWDLKDFFINKQPFGHVREFTSKEMTWMAEQAGFKIRAIKFHNIYFEWRWFLKIRRVPALISYILSQIYPAGRDIIFLVIQKPL